MNNNKVREGKKIILGLIMLTFITSQSWAQNDLSVEWSAYEAGDTISDSPFNGSFRVSNEGETSLNINDTIWFGYLIYDSVYDQSLTPELISGKVLTEDFDPGDVINIVNTIFWPETIGYPGDTLDICIVVFGAIYASFEEEWYSDDLDPTNNISCVKAVLPPFVVGLDSENKTIGWDAYANSGSEVLIDFSEKYSNALIEIHDLNGRLIHSENLDVQSATLHTILLPNQKGLYLVSVSNEYVGRETKKLMLH